jgi:hypothetical protein
MLQICVKTNEQLLWQLVKKLKLYKDQHSVDMEFMSERYKEMLLSIFEDDDKKNDATKDAKKDNAKEWTGQESVLSTEPEVS